MSYWSCQIPSFLFIPFRVATPLPYFLSEVLWVPKSDLTNVKEIPLDVVTLHPQPHPSQTRSPTSSQREVHHQCSRDTTTSVGDEPLPDTVNRHNKRLQAKSAVASSEEQQSSGPASKRSCISSSPPEGSGGPCSLSLATDSEWILDIDLDFFSTGNPYRDLFSEVCVHARACVLLVSRFVSFIYLKKH